jgi:hypothetical protein
MPDVRHPLKKRHDHMPLAILLSQTFAVACHQTMQALAESVTHYVKLKNDHTSWLFYGLICFVMQRYFLTCTSMATAAAETLVRPPGSHSSSRLHETQIIPGDMGR